MHSLCMPPIIIIIRSDSHFPLPASKRRYIHSAPSLNRSLGVAVVACGSFAYDSGTAQNYCRERMQVARMHSRFHIMIHSSKRGMAVWGDLGRVTDTESCRLTLVYTWPTAGGCINFLGQLHS